MPIWVIRGESDALLDVCGVGDFGGGDVVAGIDRGSAVSRVRSDGIFTACRHLGESNGASG